MDTVTHLSVNARVKKVDLFEGVGVAAIGKAAVVWFGINVEADGAPAKLRQIQDLMNRFFQLYLGSKTI